MTVEQPQEDSGGMFSRVAQEILDAAERVTNTMEHGLQSILSPSGNDGNHGNEYQQQEQIFIDEEDLFAGNTQNDYEGMVREQLEGSPLQGMAEQVLGGIMQQQVCL